MCKRHLSRLEVLVVVAIGALTPGCSCTKTVYVECDAQSHDLDAALDAALDAVPDAPDSRPDAPTCVTEGDSADHLENLGGSGVWAEMVVDGFGAVATIPDGTGTRIARLGVDGARRAADLVLPNPVAAIAFDGIRYWISERVAGIVQVRSVSATGTLGASISIGSGAPVYDALAVHPSGDLAVLWTATSDGSLRATVVPASGSAVETVLDARTSTVTVDLIGGVLAMGGTGAHFVAVFEDVTSGSTATQVVAKPLAPTGTDQVISIGGAVGPERANIAPGTSADSGLVTWREGNTVHAVTVDASGTPLMTDRTLLTGTLLTRIRGHGGPGTGFEVLVDDRHSTTDRSIDLYTFDATGTEVSISRRIATICALSYSEQNLAFVRNSSVRYVTWFDASLNANLTGAF